MEMIRQFAVPRNGVVHVPVPEEFNDQQVEVQVILTVKAGEGEKKPKKSGLGHLVGSLSHLSVEEKDEMNRELKELRDSWERDIL